MGPVRLINKILLIAARPPGGRRRAPDQIFPASGGGCAGGEHRARIRGDVEKPCRGSGGDHFGAYNVPVAAPAVADQVLSRRMGGRDPVPRMPRVPRAAAAETGRSALSEIRCWVCPRCGASNPGWAIRCASCRKNSKPPLHRARLRPTERTRGHESRAASSTRAAARARLLQARGDQFRASRTPFPPPRPRAEKALREIPPRASKTQPRPARFPAVNCRAASRAPGVR